MSIYAIYVDNIGCVDRMSNKKQAIKLAYAYYRGAKKGTAGRADPHTYVMNETNGEIVREYGENESDC